MHVLLKPTKVNSYGSFVYLVGHVVVFGEVMEWVFGRVCTLVAVRGSAGLDFAIQYLEIFGSSGSSISHRSER